MKNRSEVLLEIIRQKKALAAVLEGAARRAVVNQIRWNRFQLVLNDRLEFLEGLQGVGLDDEVSRQIDCLTYLIGENRLK